MNTNILKLKLNGIFKSTTLIFIFLILTAAFSGCSKNETQEEEEEQRGKNSKYFMKAKIDGQLIEFTTNDLVIGQSGPTAFNYGFWAWGKNSDKTLSVNLEDENPVGVKTYRGYYTHDNSNLGVVIAYVINQGDNDLPVSFITDPDVDDSVLNITSLSKTEAKGTFSGTLFNPATGDKVTISDGSFFVELGTYTLAQIK